MSEPTPDKRDNLRLALDEAPLSPPGAQASATVRPEGAGRFEGRFADPVQPAPGSDPQAPGYGGYGAGYGQAVGGDEIHLLDYLRVLHKHRWTAITAFLIVEEPFQGADVREIHPDCPGP